MTRLRAHFDGKVFVPLDPVDLPVGTLEIEVLEGNGTRRGSPAAVLLAARQAPRVSPADVDDLELAIDAGKMAVRYDDVFREHE
jgi:hypothetical protein